MCLRFLLKKNCRNKFDIISNFETFYQINRIDNRILVEIISYIILSYIIKFSSYNGDSEITNR